MLCSLTTWPILVISDGCRVICCMVLATSWTAAMVDTVVSASDSSISWRSLARSSRPLWYSSYTNHHWHSDYTITPQSTDTHTDTRTHTHTHTQRERERAIWTHVHCPVVSQTGTSYCRYRILQ